MSLDFNNNRQYTGDGHAIILYLSMVQASAVVDPSIERRTHGYVDVRARQLTYLSQNYCSKATSWVVVQWAAVGRDGVCTVS